MGAKLLIINSSPSLTDNLYSHKLKLSCVSLATKLDVVDYKHLSQKNLFDSFIKNYTHIIISGYGSADPKSPSIDTLKKHQVLLLLAKNRLPSRPWHLRGPSDNRLHPRLPSDP